MKNLRSMFLFLSLSLSVIAMTNCSDKINITISEGSEGSSGSGSGNSSGSGSGSGSTNKVSFNASVESLVSTKALSALPANRNMVVYAYGQGRSVTQTPDAQVNYKTVTAGMLTPSGESMYLTDGSFNFYSGCVNALNAAIPIFSNGQLKTLNNGIDYLWWSIENKEVNTSPEVINITYSHSCAQVVLKIKGGTNLTVKNIVSAQMYPPSTSGAIWSLETGKITPMSAPATTQMPMGTNSNIAQLIVLPVANSTATYGINMNINIVLNDGTPAQNNQYATSIKAPSGMFQAGHSYLFLGIIQGDQIEFDEAQVIDWIPVNETGKPLYPSQVQ